MTPQTARKTSRLLEEARVMPAGAAAVYRVRGDHGMHSVFLHSDYAHCTCPAHDACSHLRAAELLHDALSAQREQVLA